MAHLRNHSRAHLYVISERGASATMVPFISTAWRKSRTLSQSSAMVCASLLATVLPSSFFDFPLSSTDFPTSLPFMDDGSVADYDTSSTILMTKFFISAVAEVLSSRTTASVRNGGGGGRFSATPNTSAYLNTRGCQRRHKGIPLW